jgi:hypothetical protein
MVLWPWPWHCVCSQCGVPGSSLRPGYDPECLAKLAWCVSAGCAIRLSNRKWNAKLSSQSWALQSSRGGTSPPLLAIVSICPLPRGMSTPQKSITVCLHCLWALMRWLLTDIALLQLGRRIATAFRIYACALDCQPESWNDKATDGNLICRRGELSIMLILLRASGSWVLGAVPAHIAEARLAGMREAAALHSVGSLLHPPPPHKRATALASS